MLCQLQGTSWLPSLPGSHILQSEASHRGARCWSSEPSLCIKAPQPPYARGGSFFCCSDIALHGPRWEKHFNCMVWRAEAPNTMVWESKRYREERTSTPSSWHIEMDAGIFLIWKHESMRYVTKVCITKQQILSRCTLQNSHCLLEMELLQTRDCVTAKEYSQQPILGIWGALQVFSAVDCFN